MSARHPIAVLLSVAALALSVVASPVLDRSGTARAEAPALVEVDTDIAFALDEPGEATSWRVRVREPGLLAVETDTGTMQRIEAVVTDADGRVAGNLGARTTERGDYTVTIRRNGDFEGEYGFPRWDGKGRAAINLWVPDTDAFEPNDSEATRTRFVLGGDSPKAGGPVSLFPRNDADLYLIEMDSKGWLSAEFAVTELHDRDLDIWLQTDDDMRMRLAPGRSLRLDAGSHRFRLMADRPFVLPVGLTLTFTPDWDSCEPNDRMEHACALEDGVAKQVSLYPEHDRDWFSLDLPRKGVVAIAIGGLPQPAYDPSGRLLRGARISARAQAPQGSGISGVQTQVAHGTVFMDVPVPGRYLINLQAAWIGAANPVRALTLTARYFDAAGTGGKQAPFSILGIDTQQTLAFSVLAGIGKGRYYRASTAADIAAAIRDFMDLPDAPTPRPALDSSRRSPLTIDPDLQDKDPALQVAVQKAREARRIDLTTTLETETGPATSEETGTQDRTGETKEPDRPRRLDLSTRLPAEAAAATRQPEPEPDRAEMPERPADTAEEPDRTGRLDLAARMPAEEKTAPRRPETQPETQADPAPRKPDTDAGAVTELARLRDLERALQADPDLPVWRRQYRLGDGSIEPRLETGAAPGRADPVETSERLSPTLARRYLTRAIQALE